MRPARSHARDIVDHQQTCIDANEAAARETLTQVHTYTDRRSHIALRCRKVIVVALEAFPETILPNKLLKEVRLPLPNFLSCK